MRFACCSILFLIVFTTSFLHADENYVTVYSQDLALVKQVRTLTIKKSERPLSFSGVAAKIIPTSVHVRSLNGGKDFQIQEQKFEYDLVSSEKILQKYLDHPIEIIKENGELIKGTLLRRHGDSVILKTDEGVKILVFNDKMSINVRDLPEGLVTRPTLIWKVAEATKGKQTLEVSYLTKGLAWHADYVGILSEASSHLEIEGWVSVKNECGTTFANAKLKLVAGEVHRTPTPSAPQRMTRAVGAMMMESQAEPPLKQRELLEYHIYELEGVTTLKDSQIKQIVLFPPVRVTSEKKFFYNAMRDPKKIAVRLLFKNDKKSGLEKPLPAGIFRIYQEDKNSLEFVGEDRIDHTPRNEEVKLTLGSAFDLRGERRVVDRSKISKRSERQTIEIELRNNKRQDDVTVIVEETLHYNDWKIEKTNFPYTQKDARNIEFSIPVKANGKTMLRYVLLYTW